MSNADKVEKLRLRAAELHAGGALDDAQQLYRRILELRRNDREARYRVGVIRLQQGRASEALDLLEPLMAEAPPTADLLGQCGLAKSELGRRDEALADLDRALQLEPGNA